MKEEQLVTSISELDIYMKSQENFIILIPNSRSKNYQVAIEYAKKVKSYQVLIEEKLFTVCLFDLTILRDCEIACEILKVAGDWKGFAHIYKGRTLGNSWTTISILVCIMSAMRCNNYRANCLRHLREKEFLKRPDYRVQNQLNFEVVVPCRTAAYGFYEPQIPVSVIDQYQAFSVENEVYWCPFFSMDNFSEVAPSFSETVKNTDNTQEYQSQRGKFTIKIKEMGRIVMQYVENKNNPKDKGR